MAAGKSANSQASQDRRRPHRLLGGERWLPAFRSGLDRVERLFAAREQRHKDISYHFVPQAAALLAGGREGGLQQQSIEIYLIRDTPSVAKHKEN